MNSPVRLKHRTTFFSWVGLYLLALGLGSLLKAGEPIQFEFKVPATVHNPFVREIWAEVKLPSGNNINLPAFYAGNGHHAVRVRADVLGVYRLGKITEMLGERVDGLPATIIGTRKKTVRTAQARPAIILKSDDPRSFALASGGQFIPIGANLAWPEGDAVTFYKEALEAFSRNGLNWTRVWMSHWGGLNLDWSDKSVGATRPEGEFDLNAAATWDRILALAEDKGVYVQLVLQHHGQYSTRANPNWNENPWNAANPGGFLASPADFFTSPEAIKRTKQKYRYIIARWGYSSAIMAWELFNEVHWVDAMRDATKNEAAVARWHAEMAAYIRTLDHYRHLVTTSTDDLASPICAAMDYLQPHLYAPNILASARQPWVDGTAGKRPVFLGEIGDDHLALSEEIKKTGITLLPPIWAGLTGKALQPAQLWQGALLLRTHRIGELGAIAKFIAATRLFEREGLAPFSPAIECEVRQPLVFIGGQLWQRRTAPEITLPLDGREEIGLADIPRIYVGAKDSLAEGYSGRATFHLNSPRATTFTFHITDRNSPAGTVRFLIDGSVSGEKSWSEHKAETAPGAPPLPNPIAISIPAGIHTLQVENPGSPGWFDISRIETGLEIPVLAAAGQRAGDFIFAWVWHRAGIFSPSATQPVQGKIVFDAVPSGTWRAVWWDTLTGSPGSEKVLRHSGGDLTIPTPLISRHAAVVLTRAAD